MSITEAKTYELKKQIIDIGRLLWEKNLVTGYNGNISLRVDEGLALITARGTCLGFLGEEDVVLIDFDGKVIGPGEASSERVMHTAVYRNFPETRAVVHTHTPHTNGFFLENETFSSRIFEAKFYLGEVKGVEQLTPAVSDVAPVINEFKANNIVALRNHGVVAVGKNLFDAFVLIQALEEAIITDMTARVYSRNVLQALPGKAAPGAPVAKKYKLFSKEQIDEIVRQVNGDEKLRELGEKTNMTFDLAVKLDETGQVYSFSFQKGRIGSVENRSDVEFLINAPENVWRAVFNQEVDPFVATTQKKMHLKGDFAKISKFYAPCSRLFELWANVPVI